MVESKLRDLSTDFAVKIITPYAYLRLSCWLLPLFLNVLFAKKLNFKNVTWILQWVLSLVVSAPMVLFWAYVFNFLQDTF